MAWLVLTNADGSVGEEERKSARISLLYALRCQLVRGQRRVDGIFIASRALQTEYEQGDIGDVLFRVACNTGLEGIVSKQINRAYSAGKCKHWLKVKNPSHPAYGRVRESIARQ